MNSCLTGSRCRRFAFHPIVCLALSATSALASNDWTNTTSSLWRIATNWSLASAPTSDSNLDPTQITNAGTKTVTMDAATPTVNRSVRGLTISAPTGFTNTLWITDLAGGSPFSASRAVTVNAGGALRVTNSTLSLLSTFDISAGSLTLDSGLIDTTPNLGDVRVGRISGAAGAVTLNGGTLMCFGFRMGEQSGSQGFCTINGGTLLSSSVVSVGELLNSGGTLTLLAGQLIATNDLTKIGNLSPGQFDQSGGTSTLAFLSIADNLAGTFNLSGGELNLVPRSTNDWFRIGNFDTGIFNMSGGTALIHSEFHVGDGLTASGFANLTGGLFIATNELCAIGRYGTGVMTVSNATVVLTNTSVGRHDASSGTLIVQSGASVTCLDSLSIGRFANSQGSVQVTGGVLTIDNDDIWTGREGSGTLAVAGGTVLARGILLGVPDDPLTSPQGTADFSGGTTMLSSNLLLGAAGFLPAQAALTGGQLIITNATHTAVLDLVNGNFTLDGGSLTVDSIRLLTNAADFTFTAGAIQAGNMTVSNGAPFVVGDGIHAAVLQLNGGVYNFAGGLVISSNASVTGCGTIIGNISNSGTLNTNCGGVSVVITGITRAGNTATVSFTTAGGATHILEFKNSLSDPVWSSILPGVVGNGGPTNQLDFSATNGSRFYRIRVQ